MFDDLLDIVTGYNLVTPLVSFFRELVTPHEWFGLPLHAGYSCREVRRVLTRWGVRHWGTQEDSPYMILAVHRDDVRKGRKALQSAGMDVLWPK